MINNNKKISFGTRINIESLKAFKKIKQGEYIPFGYKNFSKDVVKGDEFWTEGVQTCASGVLVEKKATGWHFLDDIEKVLTAEEQIKRITENAKENISNCILIGGKYHIKDCEYSKPLFRALLTGLKKISPNITVFEQHKKFNYQTHFHYNRKTDTLTMCCEDIPKYEQEPHKCVSSMKGLLNFYQRIHIADTDTLFIHGKEISREKYPKNARI